MPLEEPRRHDVDPAGLMAVVRDAGLILSLMAMVLLTSFMMWAPWRRISGFVQIFGFSIMPVMEHPSRDSRSTIRSDVSPRYSNLV